MLIWSTDPSTVGVLGNQIPIQGIKVSLRSFDHMAHVDMSPNS